MINISSRESPNHHPIMETKSKSLYDMSSSGTEIFTHGGVGYVPPSATKDDVQTCGTLSIVSYNFGKCIEWKPNDVSIETDGSEQEWAMVNTSKSSPVSKPSKRRLFPTWQKRRERATRASGASERIASNSRQAVLHRQQQGMSNEGEQGCGLANNTGDSNPQRWLPVRIPILDIKSYRVSNKKTKLLLVHKDRLTHTAFYFQFENADCFTKSLRSVVRTRRSRHDKHTYNIVQERVDTQMPHSFSDFNLLSEQKETVWKFVSDLRSRPYETTLSTFSKFSEYLLYKNPDERPSEEVVRLLEGRPQQPQPTVSDGLKSDGLSEYQIVERREKLPPRILCPRGQPLNVHQWSNAMDADGKISDVKGIKKIIFEGGVQDSIRYEVWKYLLGYFPWNSSTHERQELRQAKTEEYFRMKLQWKSMTPEQEARFSDFRDRKTLIEKDVNRTDRTLPFFQGDDNPNLGLLYDVLMTYVMYDFDLGYVQGMSDLLSPILSIMSNEVDAFWCFVGFMKRVFRNFDMDQSGMKKQLSQLHTLLSAVHPELSHFLDEHDSGNMFFCFRWLLVWFKREFTHQEIMELWEVLWTELPCSNFHLLVSVAILEREKDFLIENNYGFTEILKHVNELSYRMNLHDVLATSAAIFKQLESSPNLTVATRRVLGLSGGSSHNSSSSEDDSLSDGLACDMATLEKECDQGCTTCVTPEK